MQIIYPNATRVTCLYARSKSQYAVDSTTLRLGYVNNFPSSDGKKQFASLYHVYDGKIYTRFGVDSNVLGRGTPSQYSGCLGLALLDRKTSQDEDFAIQVLRTESGDMIKLAYYDLYLTPMLDAEDSVVWAPLGYMNKDQRWSWGYYTINYTISPLISLALPSNFTQYAEKFRHNASLACCVLMAAQYYANNVTMDKLVQLGCVRSIDARVLKTGPFVRIGETECHNDEEWYKKVKTHVRLLILKVRYKGTGAIGYVLYDPYNLQSVSGEIHDPAGYQESIQKGLLRFDVISVRRVYVDSTVASGENPGTYVYEVGQDIEPMYQMALPEKYWWRGAGCYAVCILQIARMFGHDIDMDYLVDNNHISANGSVLETVYSPLFGDYQRDLLLSGSAMQNGEIASAETISPYIRTQLEAGKAVVVVFDKISENGNHFVVVTDVLSNGQIIVMDPMNPDTSLAALWTLETALARDNNNYKYSSLRVYTWK